MTPDILIPLYDKLCREREREAQEYLRILQATIIPSVEVKNNERESRTKSARYYNMAKYKDYYSN